MKTVPLGGKKAAGRVALVDDEDHDLVMQYRWFVQENTNPGRHSGPYARAWSDGGPHRRHLFMHNLIAGYPKPDHADGNGLNNQRSNLRPATAAQNKMNTRKRWRASSRYIGVSLNRRTGKWTACIDREGRRFHLGVFTSEEDAALAHDAAARDLFGEYARLNFPDRHAPDEVRAKARIQIEPRYFRGHSVVRHGAGDWRCKCGVPLSGGPLGDGQRGAQDVMRFHRHDLWMQTPEGKAAVAAGIARLSFRTPRLDPFSNVSNERNLNG